MKSLLIIGAGQYGRLVKELAEDCGYEKIDFLDDNSPFAIGKLSEADAWKADYQEFIVAIGNSEVRERVVALLERTFSLATLIHPSAVVSRSALVAAGCIIEAGVVVQSEACLGKACIVNAGAVVNHNSVVGAFAQVECNAVVAARAEVPDGTKVACGSVWG